MTEAAIFCSIIEKPGTAVHILSEAYDSLPYDALKAKQFSNLPVFLKPEPNFPLLLTRKIFTYNCASAAIAYLGAYQGYAWYADAANDRAIIQVLDSLYAKVNAVLCKETETKKRLLRVFSLRTGIRTGSFLVSQITL